jgi:hypothetical protein
MNVRKTLAPVTAAVLCACGGSSGSSSSDGGANPQGQGEPNGTYQTATALAFGTPVIATLSSGDDYDYYAFTVPANGTTVRFQTSQEDGTACPTSGMVDPILEVYDGTGTTSVWYADDSPDNTNLCPEFAVVLDAGTNYVAVSGWEPYPWNYRLEVKLP